MMTRRILPDEAERLLTGRVPAADDLMELHMALSAVRTRYEAAPDPGVRAGHLAAMQVAFASKGPAPAPAKRRGRMTRRASIAVAGLVLAGGSALAATGSLPAPAQDALASAASHLGFDLPRGHHEKPDKPPHPTTPASPNAAYIEAKKAWTECVREHPGGNSANGECGAKPELRDFVPHPTPHSDNGQNHGNSGDNPSSDHPNSGVGGGSGGGQDANRGQGSSGDNGNSADHANSGGNGGGLGGGQGHETTNGNGISHGGSGHGHHGGHGKLPDLSDL